MEEDFLEDIGFVKEIDDSEVDDVDSSDEDYFEDDLFEEQELLLEEYTEELEDDPSFQDDYIYEETVSHED